MSSFDKYKGIMPYGSELFGVYSPLLGWRAKQSKYRMQSEVEKSAKSLTRSILNDVLGTTRTGIPWNAMSSQSSGSNTTGNITTNIVVDYTPQIRALRDVTSAVESEVLTFLDANGRYPTTATEWKKIFVDARAVIPGRQ